MAGSCVQTLPPMGIGVCMYYAMEKELNSAHVILQLGGSGIDPRGT